ncbi:hypothetical protein JTE90_013736 [Oedothorax gibbosus]|uniref:Uncharacterized protein n=1 Tax=Oedothorax gibbosus TaxID=931172 RepID=A0AAV6UY90_9ARAC|nr:hypothetical protein JTE90_013736 [Oedothorax gibbosus]
MCSENSETHNTNRVIQKLTVYELLTPPLCHGIKYRGPQPAKQNIFQTVVNREGKSAPTRMRHLSCHDGRKDTEVTFHLVLAAAFQWDTSSIDLFRKRIYSQVSSGRMMSMNLGNGTRLVGRGNKLTSSVSRSTVMDIGGGEIGIMVWGGVVHIYLFIPIGLGPRRGRQHIDIVHERHEIHSPVGGEWIPCVKRC